MMHAKLFKESSHNSAGWGGGGSSGVDEDGLNIFHGNRKEYEKERVRQPKVDIGKKRKY